MIPQVLHGNAASAWFCMGGGDVMLDRERHEELRDFPGAHLGGMALTVEAWKRM